MDAQESGLGLSGSVRYVEKRWEQKKMQKKNRCEGKKDAKKTRRIIKTQKKNRRINAHPPTTKESRGWA